MHWRPLALSLPLLTALALPAAAAPGENTLTILDAGTDNTLSVVQTLDAGNSATVTLSGRDNGAGEGIWHRPFTAAGLTVPALQPGSLVQEGTGHVATLAIGGESNLFAAHQSGSGHHLSGAVSGQFNQAVVVQSGFGQTASFTQSGSRNSLSIRQSSW